MNKVSSSDALSRIRTDVQGMHAYAVQDSSGMLKMDAMENSHRLPPDLRAELGRRLGEVAVNRYPAESVDELKQALGRYADLPPDWSLMLGNGSDELISLLSMACDMPGAEQPASIVAPVPGFVMYAMSAQFQGLAFHGISLKSDFELDEQTMLDAIERFQPALLFLAYPNNPTGTLWNQTIIERLIEAQSAQGGLVVMDEAYQPFAARSWMDSVRANPAGHQNVLVMRTLSKFGLAGARIGYLMGPTKIVEQVDKLRPPYNISVLNAECALFAMEQAAVFAAQAAEIRVQREKLIISLNALAGVHTFPSEANMLLVRVPDAAKTFAGMKSRKVLIKNVSTMHPLLANCLRLTVGTESENDQMLAALQVSL